MIVVLSANTALDRVLQVSNFGVGRVYRAEEEHVYAGGKGLNVARTLRRLDVPVRVVGWLGGTPEPLIRRHCEAIGVEQRWVRIAGESRTCVIVADPHNQQQTVLNEQGPTITPQEQDGLVTCLDNAVTEGDTLCISGSVPPGVPDDFYGTIVRSMHDRGVRTLVDASGNVLRLALEARPWAIAPNEEEARAALSRQEPVETLACVLAESADLALLTQGREGVLLAHGKEIVRFRPPAVETVNAVGSGDAFVAGFLAGVHDGLALHDSVRLGVACGASNAARLEPEIGSREEVERLLTR